MDANCIRGDSAANLGTLLSKEGIGKILLGKRRVPKEELISEVGRMISERYPDMTVLRVGDGFLPDIRSAVPCGRTAVLVYGPAWYPDTEYLASLPEDTVVLLSQELCHQVPSVLRVH